MQAAEGSIKERDVATASEKKTVKRTQFPMVQDLEGRYIYSLTVILDQMAGQDTKRIGLAQRGEQGGNESKDVIDSRDRMTY